MTVIRMAPVSTLFFEAGQESPQPGKSPVTDPGQQMNAGETEQGGQIAV
jgi:hypothetical protein